MEYINSQPPMYDDERVQPMREELKAVGFNEVYSPAEFDEILSAKNSGSVLVVVNSVCGCAAGSARPGVAFALQHKTIPDRLITAFAGQDRDAIEFLREKFLSQYPPSSPCIALFKDGEVKLMLPRYEIEGSSPIELASVLKEAFDKECTKKGPSIPLSEFEKMIYLRSASPESLN